jgi:outer membrane protein insertion porin family
MSLAISGSLQAEEGPAVSTASVTVVTSSVTLSDQIKRVLDVRVEGNRHIRARVILTEVKTRKNDLYDPEKLRKDVQAIYKKGNFEDVALDVSNVPGGVIVTFKVVEKPVVKRINFGGNKNLSRGALNADLTLKEDYPLDKVKLNQDVEKIKSLYKGEGFAAAEVEPSIKTDSDNYATVTFDITEGGQFFVDDIDFKGVTAFPVKKIIKVMKTRRKKAFKQGVLSKDMDAMARFYKNRGYPEMKVTDLTPTIHAEKLRVSLSITIDEGPLLRFGQTTFEGNVLFPNPTLTKAIQYKAGDLFNQDKLDKTLKILQDSYGAQGYLRLVIKPTIVPNIARGLADVQFQITEGGVVYVDKIGIEGLTRTKEYVIRREIKLKEGQPFNSVSARQSVDRLNNLGFLDKVDMDLQSPGDPDKVDVIYSVVDGRPGRLSIGGGYYSGGEGLIGSLGYQNLNFLGLGQNTNVSWSYGARVNTVNLGWSEPWLLGKPIGLATSLFNTIKVQPLGSVTNAYVTQDRGAMVTVTPRFSNHYSASLGYSFVSQLRYDVAPDTPTRQAVLSPDCAADPNCGEFHAYYSVFTEQFTRDTRDYYIDPSYGTRSTLSVSEGIPFPGYSIQFVKPSWEESWYQTVVGKSVLALHGALSFVDTYGGASITDIETQLYHLGGADSVRGYGLGAVGVAGQPGNPGGKIENFYNAEMRFPLVLNPYGRSLIQGVAFYDIGGDWDNTHEITYRPGSDPTELQAGFGFGLRIFVQNMPIRLDVGFPLDRSAGQAPLQFYFSLASAFQ